MGHVFLGGVGREANKALSTDKDLLCNTETTGGDGGEKAGVLE